MLALTGKLMIKDQLTREAAAGFARRGEHMGVGLVGRTLGSVGIGNIGAELFRLMKPFDMTLIAHDPYADHKLAAELGIELVALEEVFRRSDIVNVSCPLSPQTHHLVNAERLALMKPTAYFINTARGPIVDQKALTKALQERRIAGAGLDVLEQEPPDPNDPILKLDNVILSPHALCWTDQCFAGNGAADIRAVLDVQHGREPSLVVNKAVLQTDVWKRRMSDFRARYGA
jgi:D-3-phosphoglycerate dehydrogenase